MLDVVAIAALLAGCDLVVPGQGDPVPADIVIKQDLTLISDGDWEFVFPHVIEIDADGGITSAGVSFQIYNTGQDDLLVSAVALSAGDTADFDLGPISAAVPVESLSHLAFRMSFDPIAAIGLRSATVLVTSNDGDKPEFSFAVSGYGVRKLATEGGAEVNGFGRSMSVAGDVMLVGTDDGAHIFYRDQDGTDVWGEVVQFTGTGFGESVAVGADVAIVSDVGDDCVYFYCRDQGGADNWGTGSH